MSQTSTPRAHALPDGAASYRLTPAQVQDLVGTVVASLGQEDLDLLRELAVERETPGDLTVDIGRQAVDALWDQTLADAAKSPLLMGVRVQFSSGQVREIARCGAPSLSEDEWRTVAEFERNAAVCHCGRCDGAGMLRIHTDGTEERAPCDRSYLPDRDKWADLMAFDLGDYVDVAERLRLFRDRYPEGSLQPWNPDRPFEVTEANGQTFIVCVEAAYRTPDDPRPGVGVAWECLPGKTPYTRDSELMNAQTSAWGRAIVAALAADTKKVASANEVRARQDRDAETPPETPPAAPTVAKAVARLAVVNSLESLTNFLALAEGYVQTGAWTVDDFDEFDRAAASAKIRLGGTP